MTARQESAARAAFDIATIAFNQLDFPALAPEFRHLDDGQVAAAIRFYARCVPMLGCPDGVCPVDARAALEAAADVADAMHLGGDRTLDALLAAAHTLVAIGAAPDLVFQITPDCVQDAALTRWRSRSVDAELAAIAAKGGF